MRSSDGKVQKYVFNLQLSYYFVFSFCCLQIYMPLVFSILFTWIMIFVND